MERKAYIEEQIKAGKDRQSVRHELVSQGESTAGFDEEYASVLQKLGVPEPKQQSAFRYEPQEKAEIQKSVDRILERKRSSMKTILKAVGVVIVCVLLVVFVMQLPFVKEGREEVSFSDTIVETNIQATGASAKVQGGRMGSYEGVCNDISVVAPIRCISNDESFAIYGLLSDGTVYCVDTDSSGRVDRLDGVHCGDLIE
jgi:hypothetical protein